MGKGTLVKGLYKGSIIKGISSGGGDIGTGAYNVKVMDYDGTIIAEKNLDEGKTFKLPKAPSHDGLVFQEWSATEQITDGKITVGKNDVMIGAVYTTASGKNEFDIELTTVTGLSVTLNLDGEKDWGDGTTDSLTSHTYAQAGKYTIKCDGTNASGTIFGQTSSSINYYCTAIRLAKNITSNGYYLFSYCYSISSLILAKEVNAIPAWIFSNTYSIKCVVFPSTLQTITVYLFYKSYDLKYAIIPNSVTTINNASFQDDNIAQIVIPQSITTFGEYCFSSNKMFERIENLKKVPNGVFNANSNIRKVSFDSGVVSVGTQSFSGCVACVEYDFSNHTSIPTLSNTNAFSSINKICKIKVPASLYDEWVAETNWITYADYIVAV